MRASGLALFNSSRQPGTSAAAPIASTGPQDHRIPAAVTANTRLVPYNDLAAAEAALEGAAAIIIEPVAGNMGTVLPEPGYLQGLRAACDRTGALLILDEVITGFRLAHGGAQERFDVGADITCLGKIIGGGLPVGAFGARREIMGELAPEGPCYQAGTLSGNPLATAAGLVTIASLGKPGVYESLEHSGAALEQAIVDSGAPVRINRIGSMLTPFFTDVAVTNYASATTSDTDAYGRFARALLANGIYPPPSQYECWFTGLTHTEAELAMTRDALARAADAL